MGETGAGKSSFCGLLNGTLKFVHGQWESVFKLGHGGSSLTDEAKLLAVPKWLGEDETFPVLLMDTPGLGDSRGGRKDDDHMAEVARWINSLDYLNAIVILLENKTRISLGLRANLLFFQQRFGEEMWQHAIFVVNRWSHEAKAQKKRRDGKLQSEAQFKSEFQDVLKQENGDATGIGLGLSTEVAERVPFFFIDTHYDRDEDDEQESMQKELEKTRRWIHSLPKWKLRAGSESMEIKSLIDAVNRTTTAKDLQVSLNVAQAVCPRPRDLTEAKLEAVQKEIRWRFHAEALDDILSSLKTFEETGSKTDAELFLLRLDDAKKNLRPTSKVDSLNKLRNAFDLALLGKNMETADDWPEKLKNQMVKLMHVGRREQHARDLIKATFNRWNFNESETVLDQFAHWACAKGVATEAELRGARNDASVQLTAVGGTRLELLCSWYDFAETQLEARDWKVVHSIWAKASRSQVEPAVLEMIQKAVEEVEAGFCDYISYSPNRNRIKTAVNAFFGA